MAYAMTKEEFVTYKDNKTIRRIEAVLDAADDLTALGTDYAAGSTAVVADTGAPVYMLNTSGVWKEI